MAYRLEEDRLGFGDVPVVLTHQVRTQDADGPAVAVRAGVELPLGSEGRGFGNGGVDWGVGALLERTWHRWSLFGGLNWISPHQGSSFKDAGVELLDRVELLFGSELRLGPRTSFLVQLSWIGPMTDSIPLEEIDREILDVGVGLARDLAGGGRWTVSFHEDAVAATGADFGVRLALDWGF